MSKIVDQAIAKARELPEADPEKVGGELSDYIDHLGRLRADIVQGLQSLDEGRGRRIDIEEILARARSGHAGG